MEKEKSQIRITRLQVNALWAITALTGISLATLFLVHFRPIACDDALTVTIPGLGVFPPEWAIQFICVAGIVWCAKAFSGNRENRGNSDDPKA